MLIDRLGLNLAIAEVHSSLVQFGEIEMTPQQNFLLDRLYHKHQMLEVAFQDLCAAHTPATQEYAFKCLKGLVRTLNNEIAAFEVALNVGP